MGSKLNIHYSQNQQQKYLVFGLILMILSLLTILNDPGNLFSYWTVIFAALLLGTHLFMRRFPYLKIEKDILTMSNLRQKRIRLSEVIRINKFAGDVVLVTTDDRIKIHTDLIDKKALENLNQVLHSLNPEPEENRSKKMSLRRN